MSTASPIGGPGSRPCQASRKRSQTSAEASSHGAWPQAGPLCRIASKPGRQTAMAKAYWIAAYRSVSNPDALAAYARLSGPAITAAGGRILARGLPAQIYEAGLQQRTVVIEFDSVEQARAAHDSPAYQAALV